MRSLLLLIAIGPLLSEPPPKKLFIEPRERETAYRKRNVTLELTKAILKQCPGAVSITEKKEHADYSLGVTPGSSTLYRSDGEVDHIFTAKWTVSGLAKETCGYLAGKTP